MLAMDVMDDTRLDTQFDQMLVEMKPHVLRLPHKAERQRCALWIKKFCEPPMGITARKNRNAYAQLLVHMLRKGILEGPFTDRPQPGMLPPLPSYMSIYLDDPTVNSLSDTNQNQVPSWVAGELGSEVTGLSSITHLDGLDSPPIHFQTAQDRFKLAVDESSSLGLTHRKTYYPRERSLSPPRSRSNERNNNRPPLPDQYDKKDWLNGTGYATLPTSTGTSLFCDDSLLPKSTGREVEMRSKMVEAKFQEDKLRLQQKHDTNVQKILDRKNTELEELKRHYRTKTKEQEEVIAKLDKKLCSVQKDLSSTRESRDQEVKELKQTIDEVSSSRQQDFDKKLSDIQSKYEEEKFSLQKQHTKNIQDLLDDTNTRLSKMETEYTQQMEATTAVIRELEARVQQLGGEAENLTKIRNQLERDKIELEGKVDRLQADLMGHQEKGIMLEKEIRRQKDDFEAELKSQKNKYEASFEYMKQEHNLSSVKATDKIADYEQQVAQLKAAIETSEQHRHTQTRDLEQAHQQDKLHLESLYDKKVRCLEKELDQQEQQHQKKVRKLEQSLRDKEEEMCHLLETSKHQSAQSEQALEDFKVQVERNSSKMYMDMKQQMEKVEQDLHRSKQLREKQAKEYQRQLDEERNQQHKQLAELKLQAEQERGNLLRDFHTEKEVWHSNKEHEVENLREAMARDLTTCETKARGRLDKDSKMISEYEKRVQSLKEELLHSNSLRKQQLVELGLLREEEKQKLQRDHEIQVSRLHSEREQQRLEVEKTHNEDMERMIEKTNHRLQDIEKEYSMRATKADETITDLQKSLQDLKNTMNRQQEEAEHEITMTTTRLEDEKRKMKQHHASSVMNLQQDLEAYKGKVRQSERQLHLQEQDYEEKLTLIRGQYEEKMRGLVSVSVRQELESTISSLHQQVGLLQQRAVVLQEDLDQRSTCSDRYTPSSGSLQHLAAHLGDSVNALGSSIKSNS